MFNIGEFSPLSKYLPSPFIQFNQGQSSGPAGVDVNVMPVWRSGITGRGVVVSILDDGKFTFSEESVISSLLIGPFSI